jgi:hypothetical protein
VLGGGSNSVCEGGDAGREGGDAGHIGDDAGRIGGNAGIVVAGEPDDGSRGGSDMSVDSSGREDGSIVVSVNSEIGGGLLGHEVCKVGCGDGGEL